MKRIFIPSDILRILKYYDVIKPSFECYWMHGIDIALIRFLIKENCLKEYVEERSKYLTKHKMEYVYFFVSIIASFNWSTTKQGSKFWSNLSDKYSKY